MWSARQQGKKDVSSSIKAKIQSNKEKNVRGNNYHVPHCKMFMPDQGKNGNGQGGEGHYRGSWQGQEVHQVGSCD